MKKKTAESRAAKIGSKKAEVPEVPAWFNKPADALRYHLIEERSVVRMDGVRETTLEAIIEDITPEEFVQMKRALGEQRGYSTICFLKKIFGDVPGEDDRRKIA